MTGPARLFVPLAALLVAGCASTGDYPSLSQRPAERAVGTFTPDTAEATAPMPIIPSGDLVARLADLTRAAQGLHSEFRAATPAAERLAGVAGATGSDSWAAAQVALADLDSLRSRAAVSLADLDALWVDATIEGGAREAIAAARDSVESLVSQEDAVLARLRGRI